MIKNWYNNCRMNSGRKNDLDPNYIEWIHENEKKTSCCEIVGAWIDSIVLPSIPSIDLENICTRLRTWESLSLRNLNSDVNHFRTFVFCNETKNKLRILT